MASDQDAPEIDLDIESPDGEAPQSIDDEMHETFARINADDAGTDPAAPKGDAASVDAQRQSQRDANGKFVKGAEQQKPEAQPQSQVGRVGRPPINIDVPPTSVRPGIKAQWNNLPQDVREEFHKRETDFFNGIEQYQAKAQVADHLMREIQPFQPIMAAIGADIPTSLREVLKTASVFYVGSAQQKADTLIRLAQQHGITLRSASGQTAQTPAGEEVPAYVKQLQSELHDVRSQLADRTRNEQNSQVRSAWESIVTFGNNPQNRYFADVRTDMGKMLSAGIATTLQDAYDRACRSNPQVWNAMQIEEKSQSATRQREERMKRTAAAQRAGQQGARSVPTARPTAPAQGSMDDTMRETFAAIQARG